MRCECEMKTKVKAKVECPKTRWATTQTGSTPVHKAKGVRSKRSMHLQWGGLGDSPTETTT